MKTIDFARGGKVTTLIETSEGLMRRLFHAERHQR
jgi:hypothetical protein